MKTKNIAIYVISGLLILFLIAFFIKQNSTSYQFDKEPKKGYSVNGSTVEVSYSSRKSSFISVTLNRDFKEILKLVHNISKKEPTARQINVNVSVPWCEDVYGNQTIHKLSISWNGDELSQIRKFNRPGLIPQSLTNKIMIAGIHCGKSFFYPASCETYFQC